MVRVTEDLVPVQVVVMESGQGEKGVQVQVMVEEVVE